MDAVIDSIKIIQLNSRLDSLENVVENNQISTAYYQSILDHQWTLLQSQTAIFIGILIITITLVGLVSWKAYFSKLSERMSEIEKKFSNLDNDINKVQVIEENLRITNLNLNRNLYETAKSDIWRIIWHIRYCDVLIDQELIEGLEIHIKKLEAEFNLLISNSEHFRLFLEFENMGGIKDILRKISNIKNDNLTRISTFILNKILEKK